MTLFEQAMRGSQRMSEARTRTHAPRDDTAIIQAFEAFFECSFDAEYRDSVDTLIESMGVTPHFVTQR